MILKLDILLLVGSYKIRVFPYLLTCSKARLRTKLKLFPYFYYGVIQLSFTGNTPIGSMCSQFLNNHRSSKWKQLHLIVIMWGLNQRPKEDFLSSCSLLYLWCLRTHSHLIWLVFCCWVVALVVLTHHSLSSNRQKFRRKKAVNLSN